MARVLAIDIGGSTIRGVTADESGLEVDPVVFDTGPIDSAADLAPRLEATFGTDVDAIGVAAAGVVDRQVKRIRESANWSGWDVTSLADPFDVPLVLENDADASAVGLRTYGDVGETVNLAYLTISSGIGAGILRNGRLVPGTEVGFANVDWDGNVSHAGIDNPWEGYAAGTQFPDRVAEWLAGDSRETTLTGTEDPAEFFEAVYDGDRVARDYYTRLKRINAAGIGTIADLFATDLVTVGGGVAVNHPDLVDYDDDPHALEAIDLEEYCITGAPNIEPITARDDLDIERDELELYGAAAVALDRVDS